MKPRKCAPTSFNPLPAPEYREIRLARRFRDKLEIVGFNPLPAPEYREISRPMISSRGDLSFNPLPAPEYEGDSSVRGKKTSDS